MEGLRLVDEIHVCFGKFSLYSPKVPVKTSKEVSVNRNIGLGHIPLEVTSLFLPSDIYLFLFFVYVVYDGFRLILLHPH